MWVICAWESVRFPCLVSRDHVAHRDARRGTLAAGGRRRPLGQAHERPGPCAEGSSAGAPRGAGRLLLQRRHREAPRRCQVLAWPPHATRVRRGYARGEAVRDVGRARAGDMAAHQGHQGPVQEGEEDPLGLRHRTRNAQPDSSVLPAATGQAASVRVLRKPGYVFHRRLRRRGCRRLLRRWPLRG